MLRNKLLALFTGIAIGTPVVVGTSTVQAEKPTTGAPLHRHYIEQPDGTRVYVGPDVCANLALQQGWAAYHVKVHLGAANQNLQLGVEPCNP